MKKALVLEIKYKIILFIIIILLPLVWLKGGFGSIYLDLDFARDLNEISNIWIRRIVWLGPELRHGFNITPLYYYMFYPVLLISHGNARSLIIFNMILSIITLGWLGYLGIKKGKPVWLLAILVIGLSPWWQKISLHPGNGDTYAIFILASMISLAFNKSFWLSSVLMGIAVAFHPTSIFACPLLFYEWLMQKENRSKNLLFIIGGFVIPWLPNIIFSIITKGYWIRQWLANPNWQVASSSNIIKNLQNIFLLTKLSGLNSILALLLWILTGLVIYKNRQQIWKIWYFIATLLIVFLAFISTMPDRYLYGILIITTFTFVLGMTKIRWGGIILSLLIILLTINVIKNPPQIEERSIPIQENNINFLINNKQINKKQKIAVLTAFKAYKHITPQGGITPQSNDYRFFLRTKGFQALDVFDYSQANVLIMFIEDPEYDWQEWRSWEIDQFGEKRMRFQTTIGQTRVILFDKI